MVQDVIQEYEMVSGQQLNFDNHLSILRLMWIQMLKKTIIKLLGVRVASNLEKYLGLPMMVGQKNTWAFANFIRWFRRRTKVRVCAIYLWGERSLLSRFYKLYQFTLCNILPCRKRSGEAFVVLGI